MRLFTGIAFDAATRDAFSLALERARPLADAKWETLEKAHLTLVFLADADPQVEAAKLTAVAARHAAFSLRLVGAGTFDRRILWLGVDGALEALRAVHSALGPVEARPYAPHVTLARAKQRTSFAEAEKALEGFTSPPFRVEALTLFESKNGAYVRLSEAALQTP